MRDRRETRVASGGTWLLAVQHLAQVESELLDTRMRMIDRLRRAASGLPEGDPDREVLESCVRDLETVLRGGTLTPLPPRRARGQDTHRTEVRDT